MSGATLWQPGRTPARTGSWAHLGRSEPAFWGVYQVVLAQEPRGGKVKTVLLCPVYDLRKFLEANGSIDRDALRQGLLPGLHLLDEIQLKVSTLNRGHTVAYFKTPISLPIEYVRAIADHHGVRPRLMPPYREHLAQGFARFFMRVGLPTDIDAQRLKKQNLGI